MSTKICREYKSYFQGDTYMYFEGELPTVAYGNCNNGNNGWNDWSWIIGLALVGGLFGNGGFGFGGGFGGNRGYDVCCGTPATQADLANGFAQNTLQRGIDDIILGQAQMQNFVNQGFSGLNATINGGFAGVNNAICTLGFQNQAGFNALAGQLASCCCDTRAAIADVKYANERNTCEIITANNNNTRAILDYLCTEKISALQAENAGLKAQISNDKQSAYLISQLREPCPVPAYYVPNPNCCYTPNGCGASVQ
jgi:hypothetical protein